jgi:hypothetical protein
MMLAASIRVTVGEELGEVDDGLVDILVQGPPAAAHRSIQPFIPRVSVLKSGAWRSAS